MRKFLLLLITMVSAIGAVAQTTIKMKTAKDIGEEFSLTVDPDLMCIVDWGDGVADTLISTDDPIVGNVAGPDITISAMGMTYFDASNQELSEITFTNITNLETLILSSNNLTAINLQGMNKLKSLWIDNNLITTLYLAPCFKLESLIASNNLISAVGTNVSGLTELTDCWLDNNKLLQLKLVGSKNIKTLNIENNTIDSLTLSQLEEKALAVFLDGNSLDFRSLWNKANSQKWYGTEQQGIGFGRSEYKIGETFTTTRNLFSQNQDKTDLTPASYTFTWYEYDNGVKGAKLTKGTASSTTADYYVPSATNQKNVFTFKKAFDDIQLEIKNNKYLGFLLLSDHISIIDPTGIDQASVANNLSYSATNGGLTLQADKPTTVTIYATNGQLVWKGEVAEPTRIQLNKGIYIVNNTKIVIK